MRRKLITVDPQKIYSIHFTKSSVEGVNSPAPNAFYSNVVLSNTVVSSSVVSSTILSSTALTIGRWKYLNIWEESFPSDGTFKCTRINAGTYSIHPETDISYPNTGNSLMHISMISYFVKFRNRLSVCLSVCLPVRTEHLGSHRMDFQEAWYLIIFRIFVQKIQVSLTSDNNGDKYTFMIISRWILVKMRNFSDKCCREN